MTNQAKLDALLALANQLANSTQVNAAAQAVVNKNQGNFKNCCVAARIIQDDKAGEKLANALYHLCRKLMKDADWGWE